MGTQLNELLASLYAGNPDAIAVYDRDGNLVSCNETALQLSGYGSLEAITGTNYRTHVYPPHAARVDEAFRSALSGYTDHLETTLRDQAGAIVPVEVYFFPARTNEEIAGVFAQARDRLALREAENSLGLSQQRFRSLFEYHPDAIMALKSNGVISRVNVGLEAATGFYGEQLINKMWTELVAPECREEAADAFRLAGRGESLEFDSLLLDRLGNRIDVQLKLVPLRVGESVEGAYAIAKNVVAQRSAERAIATQGERIRELYLVAAARGDSIQAQIDNTLALGCRLFGFDYAYVTRFDELTIAIVNAVGEGSGVSAGTIYPRQNALSRHLIGDRQTIFITDLDEPPWDSDPARATAPWRSYFATKLIVNNREFGALVFASRQPHAGIPELDRDLLQLMSLFVAAALERAQHAERMQQLAFYDSLTGLPNRVLFDDRIKQTMGAAKRYQRGFAVMYLDLDDFKDINDRYGHPTGDRVLKAVAERLILALRESDTVARFGGDEFVILQPVVNGATDAADLARKIVSSMQAPVTVDGVDHVVHTSIGIALYPQDGGSAGELMDRADRALYRAKHAGRNRWVFFNDDAPLKDWPALSHKRPTGRQ
jgi:diguanylate cyclase (GGDEF)-like protein/PAS domain S-box-containing protein